MTYTEGALLAVVLAVLVDVAVARTRLVTRRSFWTAYAVVVFFQLVVNGLLTGLKVVRYDPARIIGWRLVFAPIEDLLFGFSMILLTLTLWVWAGRRQAAARRGPSERRQPANPTAARRRSPTRTRWSKTS